MHSFPRAIAHIDADCFFASVELRDAPELKGKPILICNRADRRGIVVSASYEARPAGIRAGTAVFQAQKLCPAGILIPAHFEKYSEASNSLMAILRNFSPDVETASIDEAYVDLTGLRLLYRTDYAGIAQRIQNAVKTKLGITISIGIAASKLLAKMASDYKKPAGLMVVSQKNREGFLHKCKIGDVPGIGRNTEALLKKYNLQTALDAANSSLIPKILGKRGKIMQAELAGISLSPIQESQALPKSLSRTRTFPEFSREREYICSFSRELLISLLRHLRSFDMEAKIIGFFLLTKNFRIFGLKKKLAQPTSEDLPFLNLFDEMFKQIFKENEIYRKSGFFLNKLRQKGPTQTTLFEGPQKEISGVLDSISKKYGSETIIRGSLLKRPFP